MPDQDATPPDSPSAMKFRAAHSASEDAPRSDRTPPASERGRISRTVPDLDPLPVNPTEHDILIRYGTFVAFMMAQWPILADAIDIDREAHARLERMHKSHWVWPLVTGFSLAIALVSIVLQVLRH